jgi:putative OPT family oligopeptide transporter
MARKNRQLTARALILGAFLSMIVAMYSAFLGLKVGGVYWPVITTSLLSLAILKLLRNTNKNEINVAQTAASAGGLLAAGIIFTVPAMWFLERAGVLPRILSVEEISMLALIGGLIGLIFTLPLRKEMIVEEKLPYPDGTAAAELIKVGDEGGKKAKLLSIALITGAVFSILRDWLKAIPGFVNIDMLKVKLSKLFSFGSGISLVYFAGGYLIGPIFTGIWFLGAVTSYIFTVPMLVALGHFATKQQAIILFTKQFGIGIIIGSAVAYFLMKGTGYFYKMWIYARNKQFAPNKRFLAFMVVGVIALTVLADYNVWLALLAIGGAFFMAYVGARVTGEMNVDPMEIFAVIVLLAAKLLIGFNAIQLVILAAVVCIAAGIAGDMMQDLKVGYLLNTEPRAQAVAQFVGISAASVILGITLYALNNSYGIGSVNLPAPQAAAMSALIAGQWQTTLLVGMIIGFVLTALLTYFTTIGLAGVAFGIGMYVPIELSFPLFLGGIIRLFAEKRHLREKGMLIAAGIIAGEGILGVLKAFVDLGAGL